MYNMNIIHVDITEDHSTLICGLICVNKNVSRNKFECTYVKEKSKDDGWKYKLLAIRLVLLFWSSECGTSRVVLARCCGLVCGSQWFILMTVACRSAEVLNCSHPGLSDAEVTETRFSSFFLFRKATEKTAVRRSTRIFFGNTFLI